MSAGVVAASSTAIYGLPRLAFLFFNYAEGRPAGHRRLLSMNTIHMASVIMSSHDSKSLVDFFFVALKLHKIVL